MTAFFLENLGTILLTVLLAAAVAGVVRHLVRQKRQGGSSCSCGGGCVGCSGHCHTKLKRHNGPGPLRTRAIFYVFTLTERCSNQMEQPFGIAVGDLLLFLLAQRGILQKRQGLLVAEERTVHRI